MTQDVGFDRGDVYHQLAAMAYQSRAIYFPVRCDDRWLLNLLLAAPVLDLRKNSWLVAIPSLSRLTSTCASRPCRSGWSCTRVRSNARIRRVADFCRQRLAMLYAIPSRSRVTSASQKDRMARNSVRHRPIVGSAGKVADLVSQNPFSEYKFSRSPFLTELREGSGILPLRDASRLPERTAASGRA